MVFKIAKVGIKLPYVIVYRNVYFFKFIDGSDEGSSCCKFSHFFHLTIFSCFFLKASSKCSSLSCLHQCRPTPLGGVCYCPAGRMLDPANNRSCIGT